MRPHTQALRLTALASCLLFAHVAATSPSSAQKNRGDTGTWDPAVKKASPRPTPARRPAPRPAPRPQAPPQRSQRLTVQYRLLKVNDNNSQIEVSPVTVFNPGDRLRLAVKADEDVYLFVIHQKAPGRQGSIYFPDSRVNGGQNLIPKGAEFLLPSNCSDRSSPVACSFPVDAVGGQEFFTLIFSRSPSVSLLDQAAEAGGVVSAQSLDTYLGGHVQKLDASARGDTVFARAFRSLKPDGQVVIRLALNKRA